ncbi:TetR/AcrR family transcriptional regulator [Thalassovita sp.]|uniref:TetR/AcrR family transcriptional regulator n=1 Tax=Thalassovita sp. TaxID=1979401 RepID=UPI0029DE65A9|nr:TetR/AcrR family transcriptional regulator [Thalassovita sp.]
MYAAKTDPADRKRAPSKRAQETHRKVLDAAEKMFSDRGFDGTTVRDIAARAGVTAALVTFHGGPKEHLFETVVERRAQELSALRMARLNAILAAGDPDLRALLKAFIHPFLDIARDRDPGWLAYARLVAMVSADARWADLTRRCFDPTAQRFAQEMARCLPGVPVRDVAAGFVFTVSAMLSLCTSQWRVDVLAGHEPSPPLDPKLLEKLLNFCEAGLLALPRS